MLHKLQQRVCSSGCVRISRKMKQHAMSCATQSAGRLTPHASARFAAHPACATPVYRRSQRKRVLLIDGYNVLRSGTYYTCSLSDHTDDFFNAAREQLINDVLQFAGHDYKATIVFDGAGNRFSDGAPLRIGGIDVVFSPAGVSADKVIERLAHCARESGAEVLVVSSDATVQDTAFGLGVDRMSARGFCVEVKRTSQENHVTECPHRTIKRTVASRIRPESLKALRELRDSL